MSWLDDRQAADPAYPDPDTDPWASPGYAPDTSRGLPVEIAYTMGEQARQRNAGAEHPGLFQLHARLDSGHLEAARDVIADWTSGPDHISPGRDWHQLR